MLDHLIDGRQRSLKGPVGGRGSFVVERALQFVDLLGGENSFAQEAHLHAGQRIAHGIGLTLGGRAIEFVVVRERVGVGPYAMAVDERRAVAGAAILGSGLKRAEARLCVGAVDFRKVEVGKISYKARDVAAGGVYLYGNADGVAVIFHAEDDRQFPVGRGADRLPEFTLGCGAFAQGSEDRVVTVEGHITEGTVIVFSLGGGVRMAAEVASGFRTAHGVEQLRGGGGRCADYVERAGAPV